MDLSYDWRTFQSVFYPSRRVLTRQSAEPSGPVFLMMDQEGGRVTTAFAEAEDLSEWVGQSYDEACSALSHRKIVTFDRSQVDGWIHQSLELPHFHDQAEFLRDEVAPVMVAMFQRHFFLEAARGWWSKILPSAYGVFIRLDGQPAEDIFLTIRRGRLEMFQKADLISMGPERSRQPEDVVKYLSERYMVPVQGIFISAAEWRECAESINPWKKIALGIRADRVKLVPFRWMVAALLSVRAFFGI